MEDTKLLIIDDDHGICQLITWDFERLGAKVFSANSGGDGLRKIELFHPNIILLDIMMPDVDGLEICRKIRESSNNVPIIFLSAMGQQNIIVEGLELGADDFITKPFDTQILVARVRALLRRSVLSATTNSNYYQDGYLSIHLENRQVVVMEKEVKLSSTEFDILAYLFKYVGRVRTYSQILEAVWGERYLDSPEYIHTYIYNIRNKLEEDSKKPKYILTEHKIGYRFVARNVS